MKQKKTIMYFLKNTVTDGIEYTFLFVKYYRCNFVVNHIEEKYYHYKVSLDETKLLDEHKQGIGYSGGKYFGLINKENEKLNKPYPILTTDDQVYTVSEKIIMDLFNKINQMEKTKSNKPEQYFCFISDIDIELIKVELKYNKVINTNNYFKVDKEKLIEKNYGSETTELTNSKDAKVHYDSILESHKVCEYKNIDKDKYDTLMNKYSKIELNITEEYFIARADMSSIFHLRYEDGFSTKESINVTGRLYKTMEKSTRDSFRRTVKAHFEMLDYKISETEYKKLKNKYIYED